LSGVLTALAEAVVWGALLGIPLAVWVLIKLRGRRRT
jgi:hypothetical protein